MKIMLALIFFFLISCGSATQQTTEQTFPATAECSPEISSENCENIDAETMGMLPQIDEMKNEISIPQSPINNSNDYPTEGFLPFQYID